MYRYSAKQYNSALLQMGVIRVGTLHDFRCIEHKAGIADPQEGKKKILHHIDNLYIADSNDPSISQSKDVRALKEFPCAFGHLKNVMIKDLTIYADFDYPDCFILCTSKFCSQTTMQQFEGANSCIEIVNEISFYQILTTTLNSITPVIFRGVHEVIYKDKKESWNGVDWGHHPALIKEPKFRSQGELRAIWQPLTKRRIEPIILGNYKLAAVCRPVNI